MVKSNAFVKNVGLLFFLILFLNNSFAQSTANMSWWREARFGMFVHWGLYSVAAGEWKGKPIDGLGEWIQNREKIPNSEYEVLAKKIYIIQL